MSTPNLIAVDPDLDRPLAHAGRRLLVGLTGVAGLGALWVLGRALVRGDGSVTTGYAIAGVVAVALSSVAIAFESSDQRTSTAPADQGPGCTLLPVRRAPRAAAAALLLAPVALLALLTSAWLALAAGLLSAPLWRWVALDHRVRLDESGIAVRSGWLGATRRLHWEAVAAVSVSRPLRPRLLVHSRHDEPPLCVDVLLQRWSPSTIGSVIAQVAARPRERERLTDARSLDRFGPGRAAHPAPHPPPHQGTHPGPHQGTPPGLQPGASPGA